MRVRLKKGENEASETHVGCLHVSVTIDVSIHLRFPKSRMHIPISVQSTTCSPRNNAWRWVRISPRRGVFDDRTQGVNRAHRRAMQLRSARLLK